MALGPKNKYASHVAPYLDRITEWAQNGASQTEIADKLHLAASTFKAYLAKGDKGEEPYVDLSDCFRKAVEVPDDNVEAAMYKRACGYEYEEREYKTIINKDTGEKEEICTKRTVKQLPPDPTSAMFWLANRRPDRWRYRPEPVNDEDEGGTGVVELPAVMDKPAPPGEVSGDG